MKRKKRERERRYLTPNEIDGMGGKKDPSKVVHTLIYAPSGSSSSNSNSCGTGP